MITSGSCRRMERSSCANVSPICGFTWIWLMPPSWYSIGSSTVTTLRATEFSASSPVYSVVVLPEPVGPVTSTIPFGSSSAAPSRATTGRRQPQRLIRQRHGGSVQHAQHHGLAMQRRDGGNPEIHLRPAHRQLDPPVLRQPALGDVEPRHDLDPRRDGCRQARGRALHLVQNAIVAAAHAQAAPRTARYGCRTPASPRRGRRSGSPGGSPVPRWPGPSTVPHRPPTARRLPPQRLLPPRHLPRRPPGDKAGPAPLPARSAPPPATPRAAPSPAATAAGMNGSSGSVAATSSVPPASSTGSTWASRRKRGASRSRSTASSGVAPGRRHVDAQHPGISPGQVALRQQAELQQHRRQLLARVLRHALPPLHRAGIAHALLQQRNRKRVRRCRQGAGGTRRKGVCIHACASMVDSCAGARGSMPHRCSGNMPY